tara:strand:- start:41 stop:307 length:267 start_codon:yes stop_codon:yes gene_type:complete
LYPDTAEPPDGTVEAFHERLMLFEETLLVKPLGAFGVVGASYRRTNIPLPPDPGAGGGELAVQDIPPPPEPVLAVPEVANGLVTVCPA